ncbi:hypothetical protein LO772_12015 [Yinghuangia sp. ASG 101]|uniref:hypothetical protein n=1 Tax=Yinghuangia sp. ASG 101 TaxID=2896848 RepID=UPI001E2FE0E3|nr:hypothetical protein [Yinghuangia sp. ASG 101]UGQ14248.1 hypothetical protein LO772_12015 [Yinghuangia sp. ASG 101]
MTAPLLTNFEGMDHATLLAKLAGVRGDLIYESGDRLFAASQKIQSAARTLQLKRDGMVWNGSSAAVFHDWAQQLVTSAYQLADFARFQGSQLWTAGTEMTNTVNSFPPVPTEAIETLQALTAHADVAATLDPAGTTAAIQQREQHIAQEHQEAVGAMRRLASTYLAVRDSINTYPRPQFHRAADLHRVDIGDEDDAAVPLGFTSAAAVSVAEQTALASGPSSGSTAPGGRSVTPHAVAWPTASGAALPSAMPFTGTLPQAASLAGVPSNAQAPPSPAVAPEPTTGNSARTSPVTGLESLPRTVPPDRDGVSGGTLVGKGTAESRGVGGSLRNGPGVIPDVVGRTAAPNRTSSTSPVPPPGRSIPRGEGVVGGTTRSGHMAPEDHRVGSGRVGTPVGATAGAPAVTGGTASRTSAARPPLGVPGGTVGGTPRSRTPGTRGEFTQGGSGLRRLETTPQQEAPHAVSDVTAGRPMSGATGLPSSNPLQGERRSRARAEHLDDDDEAWGGRRNDGVPPVIG